MSDKDYYSILGVARDAELAQIKQAYRRLALRYHPDRVAPAGKKQAEERFKKISEAYYVLSDLQRRAEYDACRGGAQEFQKDFAQAHGFDFDEILRRFHGFSASGSSGRSSGDGFYSRMFEGDDVFNGFEPMGRGGSAYRYVFGSNGGFRPETPAREQTDVNARLKVPAQVLARGGEESFEYNGRKITLKIKPGTRPGQKLRLRAQGAECSCCRHRGDLIVEIV